MANSEFYFIFLLILNLHHLSNSQYIRLPKTKALSATIKQNVTLTCQYVGSDGDGEFLSWWKDNKPIDNDKSGHYTINNSSKETNLIIEFDDADENVTRWIVQTKKQGTEYPSECQFGRISLTLSPRQIRTDKTTENINGSEQTIIRGVKEKVILNCMINLKTNSNSTLFKHLWTYSVDGNNYVSLPSNIQQINQTSIEIKHLEKANQGYYRCSLNNQTLAVLLRVHDPYGALWPFLGIVSTVLVLIVIILIFEKYQKNAKKKAAASANDDANKALVASSKTVVDEKRTANA